MLENASPIKTLNPKILSGIVVRDVCTVELIERFKKNKHTPEIAIIQVGSRSDSTAYIKAKITFAEKVGVIARHIHLFKNDNEKVTPEIMQKMQDEIIGEVKKCNANKAIRGIIVQLPLPEFLNKDEIIEIIDPKKDIDGLTSANTKLFFENNSHAIVPATARGVMDLLAYYKIVLKNKKVTVIGRSALVGKPIVKLCEEAGAAVTVAHSKTIDLIKETKSADIIISAVGKKNLIGVENVRSGQIIVDIGRDVDFEAVSKVIGPTGAITPAIGGVGPMTVFALFENLLDLLSVY